MIENKFEINNQARIQAVSWKRCSFFNEILTFVIVLPKIQDVSVFFKFGMNFDAQIVKICNIH